MRERNSASKRPKFRIYSSYDPVAKDRKINNSERKEKFNQIASQEIRKKLFSKFKLTVLLLAAVILGYFSFISNIMVLSDNPEVSSRVEERVLEYLSLNFWNRFQFLLSSNELRNYIMEKEPAVDTAEISRALFSKHISVKLTSKSIVAIWQQGRGGQKYQLNQDGVVSSELKGDTKMPLIMSDQQFDNNQFIGKLVIDTTTLRSIISWTTELEKIGLPQENFEVNNTPRQFIIRLKDKSFYLIVSTSGVESGVEGLKKTLDELNSKNIRPSKYIDIRIPYRVYYQ